MGSRKLHGNSGRRARFPQALPKALTANARAQAMDQPQRLGLVYELIIQDGRGQADAFRRVPGLF